MKEKLLLGSVISVISLPAFSIPPPTVPVPEPSSIALFAAGSLAVAILAKFKK